MIDPTPDDPPEPGRSPPPMPLSPHDLAGHPYAMPASLGLAGVANVFAWVESVNTGTIVSFCTVAFPAMVGAAIYAINNVGPAVARFRVAWEDARSQSLSGKLDRLNDALESARAREASAKEGQELARQVAADAKDLADLNRRIAEKSARLVEESERRNAELASEMKAMARRLEDANRKLHDLSTPIQAAAQNSKLALQIQDDNAAKLDATLEQARQNAGLTGRVDDKATHLVEAVDTLARRSGDDHPAWGAVPADPGPPIEDRP